MAGKVWLVGAGPGDPGLITVRGQDVLRTADVILYDALSHPALLALASPEAELRSVGKLGGRENPSQAWITEQLIELARGGARVVRLKGGDSYLFARGAEEAEALAAAGIEFEVVPGLSSPVGTSAFAGIPLTHRDLSSSVTFITGHDRAGKEWTPGAWRKLATATDTLCILMGMRRIDDIARAIVEGGRAETTPVAVIQWGARPAQRVLISTLSQVASDVRAQGFANPAVIVVGEVVALRDKLSWFERLPLFGRRILVPRPPHQASQTAQAIREMGAEPVLFPLITIEAPPSPERLQEAIERAHEYDWVLFTSANGVERFFEKAFASGKDARLLGAARVGVIGPKTGQALARYGLRPDLVAKEFVGEGLSRDLLAQGQVRRVLIPRALVAREELPASLRRSGIEVEVVPAYETRALSAAGRSALRELIEGGGVDTALFTSSSTVQAMVDALGDDAPALLRRLTVASIGPITSATLAQCGVSVDVSAAEYTVPGLLMALAATGPSA